MRLSGRFPLVENVEYAAVLDDEFPAGGQGSEGAIVNLVVDEVESGVRRLQLGEAQVRRQDVASIIVLQN